MRGLLASSQKALNTANSSMMYVSSCISPESAHMFAFLCSGHALRVGGTPCERRLRSPTISRWKLRRGARHILSVFKSTVTKPFIQLMGSIVHKLPLLCVCCVGLGRGIALPCREMAWFLCLCFPIQMQLLPHLRRRRKRKREAQVELLYPF